MKWRLEDKIQPKHHFCIVDEIDSILIDEARTPLIISGQAEDDSKSVRTADGIVPFLKECEKDPATGDYYELSKFEMMDKDAVAAFDEKGDYRIDEKSKNITFTKQGITNLERILRQQGLLITSKDENGEERGLIAEVYPAEPIERVPLAKKIRDALSGLPSYKQVHQIKIRDTEFEKTTSKKIKRAKYNG